MILYIRFCFKTPHTIIRSKTTNNQRLLNNNKNSKKRMKTEVGGFTRCSFKPDTYAQIHKCCSYPAGQSGNA